MRLLALDTASGQCSAALFIDGAVTTRAVQTARDHARLLLPMVDALLAESGQTLRGLDGIAFGRGPGSFTGLRIAAAVTQGLAAGADRPVLPVSSLRALAAQARRSLEASASTVSATGWLACMDARMGEVYWGLFGAGLADTVEAVGPPVQLLQAVAPPLAGAAGKGLQAYPDLAESLQLSPARTLPAAEPHALDIASLAVADLAAGASWVDAALAQPVYLRNQVTHTPKNPASGRL